MNPKFSNSIKCLFVSLLLTCTGMVYAEPAGNIIRLIGTVTVVDAAGVSRVLSAGDVLNVGDTIKTGEKSAVQIQMKDAAIVAITANAALKVESYSVQKGGAASSTPDKVILTLQKGRLRTITGNAKKSGYKMKSPIATVAVEVQGAIYDMLMYPGDDTTTTVIVRGGAVLVQGDKAVCLCDVKRHLDVPGSTVTVGKKQPKDDTSDLDAILPLPGAEKPIIIRDPTDPKPPGDASP